MSTLIATFHYYRPYRWPSLRKLFLFIHIQYQLFLENIVIKYRKFILSEISTSKLNYLEKTASDSDGQDAAPNMQEASLLDDTVGSGYSPDGDDKDPKKKKNLNSKLRAGLSRSINTKRKKIGAAVAAASVTLAVVGAIIAAPSFLLTHISTMFMDKTGDLQARHSATFRRSKFSKFTDRFSIDGRRGGAVIKEMEKFGYRFEFDGVEKTKIGRITNNGLSIDPAGFDDEIADFLDKRYKIFGVSTRSARWKTKRMEAFYSRYKVPRSALIGPSLDDLKDPEAELNSRQLTAIDGEDGIKTSIEPRRVDYPDTEEGQKAFNDAKKSFDEIGSEGEPGLKNATDQIKKEGTNVADTDAAPILEPGLADGEPRSLKNAADFFEKGTGTKVFGVIKGIGNVTDVGDKMCSANNALDVAIKTARLLSSVKLMRATVAFVSADDGQRKQEASADLLKQLMKRVTLSDAVLGNFASSQGYNTNINGKFNKSLNQNTRSPFAVDGKLTGVWGLLKNKLAFPGNEKSCPVLQNVGFQVGQAVGVVALTVFTLGFGSGAVEAGATTFRLSLEKAFSQIISSGIVKSLAIGVAIDFGFDQILNLTQAYVEKTLQIPFTGQEVGGRYSAMLFSGAGVLHKQRNLKSGFVPATKTQFAAAQTEYLAEIAEERADKSFFARMFDMDDTDSLAYKTFTDVAFQAANPYQAVDNGTANIASLPGLFARAVTAPFTQVTDRAYAQSVDEKFDTLDIKGNELAVDPYGNLQPIMPDWLLEYSDPVVENENTQFLIDAGHIDALTKEPKSDAFKNHIENCVDSTDTISVIEYGDPSKPDEDCLATLALTRRFKGHLINLDSGDYLDANLFPDEISSGVAGTGINQSPISAAGLNGYTIPCQGLPRHVIQKSGDSSDWSNIPDSGTIGTNSAGQPMHVYIRDACPGESNVKSIVMVSSIHGSENGGQLVSHEILFNESLPANYRIIAIPEYCNCAGTGTRGNANGVDLNRNNDWRWESLPQTQTFDSGNTYSKGSTPASEPETKALNAFLLSLGKVSLSLHYHDSLDYVGSSNSTDRALAIEYGRVAEIPVGNSGGINIYQRGSLDAWYNEETGTPSLLVEMASLQSEPIINKHVKALLNLINKGVL